MEMDILLKPIGVIYTSARDEEVKYSYFGVDGYIEVFPEYEEGLEGIEEFSHIIVLAYLHKVTDEQRKVLKVKHRGLARFGIEIDDLPCVGVFCTDSPHRPNPIALSILELTKREGRRLYVKGLDLFNGTLVLDIKAYTPERCIKELRLPWWYKELSKRVEKRFGKVGWV